MRLASVYIHQFRSIKSLSLSLSPSCLVLVGKNEAGKSTLLRAIATIGPEYRFTVDDVRETSPTEEPPTESYVDHIFEFEDRDHAELLKRVLARVHQASATTPIYRRKGEGQSLGDFCRAKARGVSRFDLLAEESKRRTELHYRIPQDWTIVDGWMKAPKELNVELGGKPTRVKRGDLVQTAKLVPPPGATFEVASIEDLDALLAEEVLAMVKAQRPRCMSWSFSEASVLPGRVNLAGFVGNPESCLPLKNLFKIAEISDIQKEFAFRSKQRNGVANLLRRVGTRATSHLHSVWPEYKKASIEIRQNGDNIDIAFRDKHNEYALERRSDGFRRFVAFLFMIAAPARTGGLGGSILLFDEPDLSLHPSGQRFLRDELIRIAEKCGTLVVYCTHSTHMIDRTRIDRHRIVSRTDEITTIHMADASTVADEEVLYNALGTSTLESIADGGIVFEGFTDMQLFRKALDRWSKTDPEAVKELRRLGTTFAEGVKDIGRVVSLLEAANRTFFVLSDGDAPARERQLRFFEPSRWVRYDELHGEGNTFVTLEDFILPDVLDKALQPLLPERLKAEYPGVACIAPTGNRLAKLLGWMSKQQVQTEDGRLTISRMKENIRQNLSAEVLSDEYRSLLLSLAKRTPTLVASTEVAQSASKKEAKT